MDELSTDVLSPDGLEPPDGERYWATEPADDLFETLTEKVDERWREVDDSPFAAQISRVYRYYHGLYKGYDDYSLFQGAILRTGAQGERAFIGLNHLRNLIQHLLILTVRDRPAAQARANSPDFESLQDCRIIDAVLQDYMRRKRVEGKLARGVENALVTTEGYALVEWDTTAGGDYAIDELGRPVQAGDIRVRNPTILDVIRDPEVHDWSEHDWFLVRTWENKWVLAAQHGEKRTDIINSSDPLDPAWGYMKDPSKTDRIALWALYHRPTLACPRGRVFRFLKGCWLTDGPLPEAYRGELPLYRVCPAEVLFSDQGYSPAFDLAAAQEALNMAVSNILSAHDALGLQNIWSPPGNNVRAAQLSAGLRLIQSKIKPEPLQLAAVAKDAYLLVELLVKQMEILSGVNAVSRGQPEASLGKDASGKALSIIEAKTAQFASALIMSSYAFQEDVLTCMARLLGAHLEEPRQVSLAGRFQMSFRKSYSQKTFQSFDRVVIESGNPALKSFAGKMDLAQTALTAGWTRVPEEFLHVLTTGKIEPLFEADLSQLALIAQEKDTLLQGGVAPVLKSDYHGLHLREEIALLNSPEVRTNPQLTAAVLGHCLVHQLMLYLPDVRDLQAQCGWQVPPVSPGGNLVLMAQMPPNYAASFSPQEQKFLATPPAPAEGAMEKTGKTTGADSGETPPQGE